MRRWPSAAAFPPAPPRPGGARGPRRPFAEAPAHLPLPSLGCFNPGARSSALDYAGAKPDSATPRPMTSLMLTAPGECQMEQPATASSQGEKSLRSTLEVCNDQRNWAVESGPVGVTEETLAQAFGGGFTGASWEGRYPGPVTALSARRARRARARRCPPLHPPPRAPTRPSTGRYHLQAGPSSQQALPEGGTRVARGYRSATSTAQSDRALQPRLAPGGRRGGRAGALVLAQAQGKLLPEMSANWPCCITPFLRV